MLNAASPIHCSTNDYKTVPRRRVRDEVGNEVEGVAAVSFHSFIELSVNIGKACKVVTSISVN